MRKGLLIFCILLTMTFGTVLGQMAGNYKSAEYNLFERGILYLSGTSHYVGGMDLTLNSDSSFLMITCSVIDSGKWSIVNDSLYLDILTRKARSDSINSAGGDVAWLKKPYRPKVYKIIDNGFYREIYLKDEKKGKIKSVDKLIKNNMP